MHSVMPGMHSVMPGMLPSMIFYFKLAMAANYKKAAFWLKKNLFKHLHKTIPCNKPINNLLGIINV